MCVLRLFGLTDRSNLTLDHCLEFDADLMACSSCKTESVSPLVGFEHRTVIGVICTTSAVFIVSCNQKEQL